MDQESKDIVIGQDVIDNFQNHLDSQYLKKAVYYMIACQLPEQDVKEFREV